VTSSALEVLAMARDLLRKPESSTAGLWPRAAALLARQALEMALDAFWKKNGPGLELCSTYSQLICLRQYWPDEDAAGQIHMAWVGLSRACHHHPYELAPTAGELERWFGVVDGVIRAESGPA
jgi:hypothetical protein